MMGRHFARVCRLPLHALSPLRPCRRLSDALSRCAGEEARGACRFLRDKKVDDRTGELATWAFNGQPGVGQKRGNVDTYLWKEEYQCDHGPEDDRVQAGPLPAKKQRTSKKASGLSLKVRHTGTSSRQGDSRGNVLWALVCRQPQRRRALGAECRPIAWQVGCKAHFTLREFMRPDLRGWCKVSYFMQQHSGHGVHDLPQHRRQWQLSDAAKAFAVQCLVHRVPPAQILVYNRTRLQLDWQRSPDSTDGQLDLQVRIARSVVIRARCSAAYLTTILAVQGFLTWVKAHPWTQRARDLAMTPQDIRNLSEKHLPNQQRLDSNEA